MFSGIVEAKARLLHYAPNLQNPSASATIILEKPISFNDLSLGDSIAVNGVCLTLESFTGEQMQFTLGAETLAITRWSAESLAKYPLNLERSLKWSDRVHGHIVTGHVDGVAQVVGLQMAGVSLLMTLELPAQAPWLNMIWHKGSLTVNGVSLTVNEVQNSQIKFCLIPETLARTNLSQLKVGDSVNIEVDPMARGLARFYEQAALQMKGVSSEFRT